MHMQMPMNGLIDFDCPPYPSLYYATQWRGINVISHRCRRRSRRAHPNRRRKSPQIAAPQKIYNISCNTGIVPSMTSIGVMQINQSTMDGPMMISDVRMKGIPKKWRERASLSRFPHRSDLRIKTGSSYYYGAPRLRPRQRILLHRSTPPRRHTIQSTTIIHIIITDDGVSEEASSRLVLLVDVAPRGSLHRRCLGPRRRKKNESSRQGQAPRTLPARVLPVGTGVLQQDSGGEAEARSGVRPDFPRRADAAAPAVDIGRRRQRRRRWIAAALAEGMVAPIGSDGEIHARARGVRIRSETRRGGG